jgi:hypothetical protein
VILWPDLSLLSHGGELSSLPGGCLGGGGQSDAQRDTEIRKDGQRLGVVCAIHGFDRVGGKGVISRFIISNDLFRSMVKANWLNAVYDIRTQLALRLAVKHISVLSFCDMSHASDAGCCVRATIVINGLLPMGHVKKLVNRKSINDIGIKIFNISFRHLCSMAGFLCYIQNQ